MGEAEDATHRTLADYLDLSQPRLGAMAAVSCTTRATLSSPGSTPRWMRSRALRKSNTTSPSETRIRPAAQGRVPNRRESRRCDRGSRRHLRRRRQRRRASSAIGRARRDLRLRCRAHGRRQQVATLVSRISASRASRTSPAPCARFASSGIRKRFESTLHDRAPAGVARRWLPRPRAAAAPALAFLALAGVAAWLLAPDRAARAVTIAVLPLANFSSDAAQEYLVDGMTEALIASLARLERP